MRVSQAQPSACSVMNLSWQNAYIYIIIYHSLLCLQVLRQIQYTNRKPAYYLNRVFKLTCSELNGRFMSNEYVQTVCISV
jgi:hypothetical protein